jgi:hypothetical protein
MTDRTGGCLCGGVRYRVSGPLRQVVACHCGQCRRTSGHHAAFTACFADDLVMESDRGLRWYRSSPEAERGFCGECGSNLFWRPVAGRTVAITAGTLDGAAGLSLMAHAFTADKGAYYHITDDLPHWPESIPGLSAGPTG